jgi:peptide/nickel transport system permease protein
MTSQATPASLALEAVPALRRQLPLAVDVTYRLFRDQPLGVLGLLIVVLMMAMAIFAPLFANHSPSDLQETLSSPTREHFFGTDSLGRDVYSRVVYGARVSVTVGFGAIGVSMLLCTLLGMASGYAGGLIDTLTQRVVDALMSFPWLVLLLTLVAVAGHGLPQLIMALGVIGAAGAARVVRSAVLSVKTEAYVEAARALGAGPFHIMYCHVFPNILAPIMVAATTGLGSIILAEASLSFLGFGVPPPTPSWGRMLSEDGMRFLTLAPWIAVFPGLAITLVVYGFNMLGDALRDLLDPRLRGLERRARKRASA